MCRVFIYLQVNRDYTALSTIIYHMNGAMFSCETSWKKVSALLALHEFCRTQSGENAEMKPFDEGILDNFRLSAIYYY